MPRWNDTLTIALFAILIAEVERRLIAVCAKLDAINESLQQLRKP